MIARLLDAEGNLLAEGWTPKFGPENPIEFELAAAGAAARLEVTVELRRAAPRARPGDAVRVDCPADGVPPGVIRVGPPGQAYLRPL